MGEIKSKFEYKKIICILLLLLTLIPNVNYILNYESSKKSLLDIVKKEYVDFDIQNKNKDLLIYVNIDQQIFFSMDPDPDSDPDSDAIMENTDKIVEKDITKSISLNELVSRYASDLADDFLFLELEDDIEIRFIIDVTIPKDSKSIQKINVKC